jgi:hypothetical protein
MSGRHVWLKKLEVVPPIFGAWAGDACSANGKVDMLEELPPVGVDGIRV